MQNKTNKLIGSGQQLLSYVLLLFCLTACNHKNVPDVSKIAISVHIDRFDQALDKLDTANITPALQKLEQQFPLFLPSYIEHIMNFGPYSDTSHMILLQTKMLVGNKDFRLLQDSINAHYKDVKQIEEELAQSFKFIKYYFPQFQPPTKVVTFSSMISNYGAVTVDSTLGIGLDMYLGENFPIYGMLPDYPGYMVRKFSPEYLVPNCIQVLAQQLYPGGQPGDKLVIQLVNAGKQQYFMEQVMPYTDDSLRLGYTGEQVKWCLDNEQMIWQYFVQQDLLYKSDWQNNMHFMNDGPSTQGMPEGSPGRIGSFVGWRIVQAYMKTHPDVTLKQLMDNKDAMSIFQQSKYRPK
jgi:hypothetical protein